jgi:uncharacterized protein YecT (DUF1311 family)
MRLKALHFLVLFLSIAPAAPAGANALPGGYYKLWRVVRVIAAPWASAATLPAATQALSRAGVAFLDDAVKGPGPLACAHATYSDRDTSFDDLFAGRIAEDKIQEVFKTLGLEDVSPYGLRVICGGEVTTYLRIHSADLLVRAGDVILRLAPRENESGVDVAEWVQPITPGFDCDKASTTAEQLICMDFDVARLDRTIARLYAALRHDVSEASFATIQTTQRIWLGHTARSCAGGPLPADWIERRDMTLCLRTAYEDWATLYKRLKVTRIGSLAIEPRMHIIAAERPRDKSDWIVYPWMIGSPEATATAFNALIERRLVPQATYLTGERVLDPHADYPISAWRDYAIDRAKDRSLSISIFGQVFNGGTQGEISETIRFDMDHAAVK